MRRGFHWYNAAEWAFILFTVLVVLGVAANGLNERGIADSLVGAVVVSASLLAGVLAVPAAVVAFFAEAGGLAFLALLLAGLFLFRQRLGELLVAVAFLLFLLALVF